MCQKWHIRAKKNKNYRNITVQQPKMAFHQIFTLVNVSVYTFAVELRKNGFTGVNSVTALLNKRFISALKINTDYFS